MRHRHFILVGRNAKASPDFHLEDIPGTSGRLDALLHCIRAGLLVADGIRKDSAVYLVLLGGAHAPRVLRFLGDLATFLRPDERALAVLVQKALSKRDGDLRPGITCLEGGLEAALHDIGHDVPLYYLDSGGTDLRTLPFAAPCTFVVGDHLGLGEDIRTLLNARGAKPISLGPVVLHASDALALVHNEFDRRTSGSA